MATLITGADGFAGKAIALGCLQAGQKVHVLVRTPESATSWNERGAQAAVGSIADPSAIAAAAKGCDSLIHAASVNSPGSTPRALGWINVAGTENALKAAAHVGCGRFIHLSCADVTLHRGDRVGWNETKTPAGEPLGPHARTKLLAEAIVLTHTGPMDTIALRPTWIWGPGDTSRLPHLCQEMLTGGIRLIGAGDSLIATVYIDHVVQAALGALETSGIRGEAFCLNDPEMLSTREFFSELSRATGGPPPRKGLSIGWANLLSQFRGEQSSTGLRPSDVALRGVSSYFDYQRATAKLGYSPEASFASGIEALAIWSKELGGFKALAEQARPPVQDADIAEQAAAAASIT